jgi:hypothetical protein
MIGVWHDAQQSRLLQSALKSGRRDSKAAPDHSNRINGICHKNAHFD